MQYLLSFVQRRRVNGTPSSLLKDPIEATVSPSALRIESNKSLVVVFPWLPVIPITFRSFNSLLTWAANLARASNTSPTKMWGVGTGRLTILSDAPIALASDTKS